MDWYPGRTLGLIHYLIKFGSKQLRASGTLVKPEDYASRSTELFAPLHDVGKLAGKWGLYALIALVLVALWQRINYRRFVGLHRLMVLLYLIVAFHALVFVPTDYWRALAGPVTALLILAGGVRVSYRCSAGSAPAGAHTG